MPKDVFKHLKRVWVCSRQLNITLDGDKKETAGESTLKLKREGKSGGEATNREKKPGKRKPKKRKKKSPVE
jgi:hypothetical protein